MGALTLMAILGPLVSEGASPNSSPARYEYQQVLMGVPVRIVVYSTDEQAATRGAEAAFARVRQINNALSDYEPDNELGLLCRGAGRGQATRVSDDLWRVLWFSQSLAEQTQGAFDVTIGPVVRLWRQARRKGELPSPGALQDALSRVGYARVRLDAQQRTVELLVPGMRLDFGGVAKGFAVDEALAVLRQRGLAVALVEAGGDVALGDAPPGSSGWRVGLTPLEPDAPPHAFLRLARCAVATSGDAFQFIQIQGQRYSHIVDPRTGLGLTARCQVTVVAPDGMTADGLATAVNVLGPLRGLKFVDGTPGAAALIVRASDTGLQTLASCRWNDLPQELPAEASESGCR